MTTPGSILPGGIVLIDEPASCGVTTFTANGEVLLTCNFRDGGDISQFIMGLTPNQVLQLIKALQANQRALVEGKGGARFP